MRILLQFPEGLKQEALKHAKKLEAEGHEVFISASPTYGACDLALDEAKNIKADKLIHFGHAEFSHVDFNVEYISYQIDMPLAILPQSLPKLLPYKSIGIVTTIQHVHQLDAIKEFYKGHGKEVFIGRPYGFAKKEGQLLGCDIGSAASINSKVECFVYVGGGLFHPLGALLATTKPFLVVDPFNNSIDFIDGYREQYTKRKKGRMLAAMDSRNFGIMMTTKNGQHNLGLAKILKARIEKEGMNAEILIAGTFDFESLDNMREFDAFVNTACPRIAIDDVDRTRKPLLSANELMEVLRMKKELKEISTNSG